MFVRIDAHHHAKFSQNWSIQSRHIAIFQIFKMAADTGMLCWIFEIAKFYWLFGTRGSRCISMPNFVKIAQSVAAILRFCRFSRMRPPPYWIFEIVNFYLLTVSGGPDASLYQIWSKSVVPLRRYCNFF